MDRALHARVLGYKGMVNEFRFLTGMSRIDSGRCCEKTRGGAPECCYQIADGDELTFTDSEVRLLEAAWQGDPHMTKRPDGMFVLDRRRFWDARRISLSLAGGLLADTLECASHPTRPEIDARRQVTGVWVIDACNADVAMDGYKAHADRLVELWQQAVELTGVKPYYVSGEPRAGWVRL